MTSTPLSHRISIQNTWWLSVAEATLNNPLQSLLRFLAHRHLVIGDPLFHLPYKNIFFGYRKGFDACGAAIFFYKIKYIVAEFNTLHLAGEDLFHFFKRYQYVIGVHINET